MQASFFPFFHGFIVNISSHSARFLFREKSRPPGRRGNSMDRIPATALQRKYRLQRTSNPRSASSPHREKSASSCRRFTRSSNLLAVGINIDASALWKIFATAFRLEFSVKTSATFLLALSDEHFNVSRIFDESTRHVCNKGKQTSSTFSL